MTLYTRLMETRRAVVAVEVAEAPPILTPAACAAMDEMAEWAVSHPAIAEAP